MKNKITFTLIALFTCISFLKAQDLIYKKDNSVLVVKITEIGLDEIKYKDFAKPDGPVLVIDKAEVKKIKYENGKEEMMIKSQENAYADNKKQAIKADFLAPMFGQFTLGYERSLVPGKSFEVQLGLVGLGNNNYSYLVNTSANGFFIRGAYKLITMPDYYLRGMKYAHILKGFYIKPELTYGVINEYTSKSNYTISGVNYTNYTATATIFGLMLDFGKQWVIDNNFVLDYFLGIGYGAKSTNKPITTTRFDRDIYWGNSHAFLGPYGDFPFAFTSGLKIGFLIK